MSAGTSSGLHVYCGRFQTLHTDRHPDGTPRPHKAVMLLAVLSLADNGQLPENRIVYGPELLELFRRFFAVVRGPTDQCTPWNPFFYLKSEWFFSTDSFITARPLPSRARVSVPERRMNRPRNALTGGIRNFHAGGDKQTLAGEKTY